jgi:hypothetical protein
MADASFVAGLAAGFIGFVIQDRISHLITGFRFRKRIACDIEIVTRNYMGFLPRLKGLAQELEETLDRGELPADPVLYHPIWSNEFTLLPHLVENSAHLAPAVFETCVDFYDVCGRVNEIRIAHNASALHLGISDADREKHLRFIVYCRREQILEYATMIKKGGTALRSLSRRYLIRVDPGLLDSIFAPS